ncbi:MAG TPA: CDP-diacylglycerol--glycerol-3-phosphate 3-phosphatidyltransferase [Gammaproteobacteria bacterium]|nr:CDP-diacylglycerol--glycerol-3-phosphate 3-phosphatidyltransferase [Gammaproteobacteria bacterium]
MKFNLPNALTWFRVVAIPLVVLVFYGPELFGWDESWARPAAGLLFGLAGITDYFDGYLARRLGLTSSFGAFLDPVADKLIVSTALVLLVQADPQITLALVAAIIIGREITVSALREWMSQIGARAHVAVSIFGKWKTTLQIIGISFMLYREQLLGLPSYRIGEWLVYVAAALTLWSMIDYLRAAWPAMRDRD